MVWFSVCLGFSFAWAFCILHFSWLNREKWGLGVQRVDMDSRHVLLPLVFNTETNKMLETLAKG